MLRCTTGTQRRTFEFGQKLPFAYPREPSFQRPVSFAISRTHDGSKSALADILVSACTTVQSRCYRAADIPPIMPILTDTYDSIHRDYEAAISWMRSLGISIAQSGRIGHY